MADPLNYKDRKRACEIFRKKILQFKPKIIKLY